MKYLLLSIIVLTITMKSNCQIDSTKQSKLQDFKKYLEAKQTEALGKQFSNFAGRDVDSITSNLIKDKVVFVNLWFKSCHPCMAEMKALNELYAKYKKQSDFLFLSFTYEDIATINKIKEKYKIKYPIFSISNKECLKLTNGNGFPVSMILDKKEIINYFKSGGHLEEGKASIDIIDKYYPVLNELLNK